MNGFAVLSEISDRAAQYALQGDSTALNHVVNFTLLPMSQGDQELLTGVLGRADLTLTSGGFGICRIMATRFRHVWAVQYLNAMDNTILDTIEIGDVPEAAVAADVDFQDSAERLGEIMDAYLS
jgi:hydrogenase-1 operon protein HyaF